VSDQKHGNFQFQRTTQKQNSASLSNLDIPTSIMLMLIDQTHDV
jgi:hypothetical protein